MRGDPCAVGIERLESRTLFGAHLAPLLTGRGTLIVSGGDFPDIIGVARKGANIRIVQIHGQDTQDQLVTTFPARDVRRIVVEGNGGDDKVAVQNNVSGPVTLSGGAGNDQLAGPQGATLMGGGGNDKLVCNVPNILDMDPSELYALNEGGDAGTPKKRAQLLGGDGNDTLVTWKWDTVVGGRGNDTVYLAPNNPLDPFDGLYGPINVALKFGPRASGVETFSLLPFTIPA